MLEAAAEAGEPFADAAQSERARLVEVVGGDAAAVVGDLEDDVVTFFGQADFHLVGSGVLADVGQRLLEDPEQRDRCALGEFDVVVGAKDAAGDAGTLGEVFGLTLDRCRETEVPQDARTQFTGDPAHGLDPFVHQLAQRGGALRQHFGRRVELAGEHRNLEFHCDQMAAEHVMDVAGDTLAFLLLDVLQVVRQFRQLALRLAQFGFCLLAVRDVPHHAFPGHVAAGQDPSRGAQVDPLDAAPRRANASFPVDSRAGLIGFAEGDDEAVAILGKDALGESVRILGQGRRRHAEQHFAGFAGEREQ